MPDTPCLHCAIVDLAQDHMTRYHLSANEVAYKQVEALAELIAMVDSRNGRRQFIRSVGEQLRRQVTDKAAENRQMNIEPFTNVRSH